MAARFRRVSQVVGTCTIATGTSNGLLLLLVTVGHGVLVWSVFRAGAHPLASGCCLGSAEPIACDATAGSDLDTAAGSWTIGRRGRRHRQHRACVPGEPG